MTKAIFALMCLLVGGVPLACQEALVAERCTGIPPGGCPRTSANVCSDPSCEAVYVCSVERTWALEYRCPPHDGGVREASVVFDAPAPRRDAAIDAPPGAYGGPGCTSLQQPDCALGVVLECTPGNCCGCEDLFVCEQGGWRWWGVCENGVPTQPDR
jgi:hypothetical protein